MVNPTAIRNAIAARIEAAAGWSGRAAGAVRASRATAERRFRRAHRLFRVWTRRAWTAARLRAGHLIGGTAYTGLSGRAIMEGEPTQAVFYLLLAAYHLWRFRGPL